MIISNELRNDGPYLSSSEGPLPHIDAAFAYRSVVTIALEDILWPGIALGLIFVVLAILSGDL